MAKKRTAAKPRSRKTKTRQDYIPGMEPIKNEKVHPLAIRYADRRDERIAANLEEKEAHDTLLAEMLEEGLTSYKYGDLEVHIDRKHKVKVNTHAEANGEAKDDE